jgi:hypothetical protein
VLFVAVIAFMGIIAETRVQLALSLLSAGLVLGAYFVFRRGRIGGGSGPGANRRCPRGIGGAVKERDPVTSSSRRARPFLQ